MRETCLVTMAVSIVCTLTGAVSGAWTEPEPVTEVNLDNAEEWSPFLSFDGLTLYFARVRSPDSYNGRIFQATRPVPTGPFAAVEQVPGPLNESPGHVVCEWVSPDNLRMYYHDEVAGTFWLKMSERTSVDDPWPQGTGIDELNALGCRLQMPRLTADECVLVFDASDIPGGQGDYDLWIADRPDRFSPFCRVQNLAAVNTPWRDLGPYLSPDGLRLYLTSNRGGPYQLFVAERPSRDESFADPVHLPYFDTPEGHSMHPCLASDGSALYFRSAGADRATADIVVSYFVPGYFVDAVNGRDTNDGLSPRTAFASIQRAIDLAVDGDGIYVYPGVYREEVRFLGKAITLQSAGDAAIIEAPDGWAVSFQRGEGSDSVLRNFVIRDSRVGIWLLDASPTIANVTVVGNLFGIDASGRAEPRISNSILWHNVVSDLYGCRVTYSCVQRGAEGEGNFHDDQMFADPGNDDYHLPSEWGRYWPEGEVWVLDDVTSPCIDAGDPLADFASEREPDGGRVNVGAHGGTGFASLSPAGDEP